jgi:hypothetical protein
METKGSDFSESKAEIHMSSQATRRTKHMHVLRKMEMMQANVVARDR